MNELLNKTLYVIAAIGAVAFLLAMGLVKFGLMKQARENRLGRETTLKSWDWIHLRSIPDSSNPPQAS